VAKKIQRNALCPCGSGKKYKKCCMINARDEMLANVNRRDGVMHALAWVRQHYSEQTDQWVKDVWLADMSEQQCEGIGSADARIRSIHDVNLLEQLVAEGRYADIEGENCPLALILNADDLVLDAEQRDYLSQLSKQPLRLYQVTACQTGKSFTVCDTLQSNSAGIVITDSYGSRMLDVDDKVGLRLMQTSAGWETSGAIYHIPDAYVDELEQTLQDVPDDVFGMTLIHFWLKLVAAHA